MGKTPDFMEQLISFVSGLTKWLADFFSSMLGMLSCPELEFLSDDITAKISLSTNSGVEIEFTVLFI